ncbi:MAG: hypothetical protein J6A23_14165, partial [Thermoguttaceae bacterium]|nr:hypothetical protein [Thermoguttaceae bacterium]
MARKYKTGKKENESPNVMKENAQKSPLVPEAVRYAFGTVHPASGSLIFGLFCFVLFILSAASAVQAQVDAGSSTLQTPEPAPPGASSIDPYGSPAETTRPLLSNSPSHSFNAFHFGAGTDTRLFQNFGVDLTWITPSA